MRRRNLAGSTEPCGVDGTYRRRSIGRLRASRRRLRAWSHCCGAGRRVTMVPGRHEARSRKVLVTRRSGAAVPGRHKAPRRSIGSLTEPIEGMQLLSPDGSHRRRPTRLFFSYPTRLISHPTEGDVADLHPDGSRRIPTARYSHTTKYTEKLEAGSNFLVSEGSFVLVCLSRSRGLV